MINGGWKDTVAQAVAINPAKMTVTITVEMFGRDTSVELNFSDVRKM